MSNVLAFPVTDRTAVPVDPCYGLGRRMLTLEQVCLWLNVTERHVRKLVERDVIPYRKVGRLLRFSEPEIEEWTRPAARPVAVAVAASHAAAQFVFCLPAAVDESPAHHHVLALFVIHLNGGNHDRAQEEGGRTGRAARVGRL